MKNQTKTSPLYTSKANAEAKRRTIARLGKDNDGAFRVTGRLDKQT